VSTYIQQLRETVISEGLADMHYGEIFGATELARGRLGPTLPDQWHLYRVVK
jgi:hypothetical protein